MVKTIILLCIQLIFKRIAAVQMWLSLQNICYRGSVFCWILINFVFIVKNVAHVQKLFSQWIFFVPDSVMMLTMTILFWNASKLYISHCKYTSFPLPLFFLSHSILCFRYELLTPNVIPKGFMDGKKACEKMVRVMCVQDRFVWLVWCECGREIMCPCFWVWVQQFCDAVVLVVSWAVDQTCCNNW